MAASVATVRYIGVTPEERFYGIHCIGWVGPSLGLGSMAKRNTRGNTKKRNNDCIRPSLDAIHVMNTRDRKSCRGYFQFGLTDSNMQPACRDQRLIFEFAHYFKIIWCTRHFGCCSPPVLRWPVVLVLIVMLIMVLALILLATFEFWAINIKVRVKINIQHSLKMRVERTIVMSCALNLNWKCAT
jgi:hypothetical protein